MSMCHECRFWGWNSSGPNYKATASVTNDFLREIDKTEEYDELVAECHRHPPLVFWNGKEPVTAFPETKDEQGCAEFLPVGHEFWEALQVERLSEAKKLYEKVGGSWTEIAAIKKIIEEYENELKDRRDNT